MQRYRLLTLLALAFPVFAVPAVSAVASPGPAAQTQSQARSFVVMGPSSDADLQRLRDALSRIDGVEQLELSKRAGSVTVRIRGNARQQALSAAAMAIGFDLLSPPMRTYIATGPSSDADIKRLREALASVAESSQIQMEPQTRGALIRVRGDSIRTG